MAAPGLLVFFHFLGITGPIEDLTVKALDPFLSKVYRAGTSVQSGLGGGADPGELLEENKDLKQKLAAAIKDEARLAILEEENAILRQSLGFLARNGYEYVMSEVISRGEVSDSGRLAETIIINKGKEDGIKKGQAVAGKEGAYIGKVMEVKSGISLVYLNNNGSCRTAAAILNEDGTQGIVEGELGLTVKMNFIPQSEKIKEGDIVITSGLEELIPRGLVIGRIKKIYQENNDLWQWAEIDSVIEPDNLLFVSVIKG